MNLILEALLKIDQLRLLYSRTLISRWLVEIWDALDLKRVVRTVRLLMG